ncbi:recombinase family protein [Amycolatopsis sp. NPDC059657]|uniref:recombinase family protein n=1 Tax=Amycolatopsis sp. NPDC059657 TaxID=3346899 RepID=UPI00366FD201
MTACAERPVLEDQPENDQLTRPLAYGYMRVPCDIPDDKVRRMEHELRRCAERQGWYLVTIFSELDCGRHEAFDELTLELQRADAHYVIVPTFRHLARNAVLQNVLLARLEFEAGAEVLELVETS